MSAGRRLAKLESSLPPREAVLHWLAEVHEHGSLDTYVAWLLDRPAAQAPAIVIIERARAAARASHAGEPRPTIRAAEDRAVADAVFLFMLVLELERVATAMIQVGRLRLAALSWEQQARTAESATDRQGWAAWRTGVLDLARGEAVRRTLQDRYLDEREVVSPDMVASWRELRDGVTALVAEFPTVPGSRRRRPDRDVARGVERSAAEEARTFLERVRARACDVLGGHAAALAIVERSLRGAA